MKLLFLSLLLLAAPTRAANNAVHDGCKRLCESESECVRKCVGHSELFELRSEFIHAVTDWTKKPDDRMRALRSGANLETLTLCKDTGWSLDNMMICLRSYPSREVIKGCKSLSTRQEEQVRCVRLGKTEAEVDACNHLFPGSDRRLDCLERNVTARDIRICRDAGGDTWEKTQCLEKAEIARTGESKKRDLEARIRQEREKSRAPANLHSY